MIIRKPYAFLIKHFKKIHIILLFLSAFIYYKHLQITSFVNEFMRLETYDIYNILYCFKYHTTIVIYTLTHK